MNRITRMLTITGLGLVTGLTIGAGPAMASTATGQGTSPSATSATQVQDVDRRHDRDRDRGRVVGFFRSYRACDWAGERSEDRNRWDDYDCEPRGFGFNRRWALEVSWDRHHRWNDDNNNNDNDHWHH